MRLKGRVLSFCYGFISAVISSVSLPGRSSSISWAPLRGCPDQVRLLQSTSAYKHHRPSSLYIPLPGLFLFHFLFLQEKWTWSSGGNSAGSPVLTPISRCPMFCTRCSARHSCEWIRHACHLFLNMKWTPGTECLSSHSSVPDHAHFVCESLDAALRLASEPPLAGLIEIVWIVGGVQVYKVVEFYFGYICRSTTRSGEIRWRVYLSRVWGYWRIDLQNRRRKVVGVFFTSSTRQ